jgi:hypothetical protein
VDLTSGGEFILAIVQRQLLSYLRINVHCEEVIFPTSRKDEMIGRWRRFTEKDSERTRYAFDT